MVKHKCRQRPRHSSVLPPLLSQHAETRRLYFSVEVPGCEAAEGSHEEEMTELWLQGMCVGERKCKN